MCLPDYISWQLLFRLVGVKFKLPSCSMDNGIPFLFVYSCACCVLACKKETKQTTIATRYPSKHIGANNYNMEKENGSQIYSCYCTTSNLCAKKGCIDFSMIIDGELQTWESSGPIMRAMVLSMDLSIDT